MLSAFDCDGFGASAFGSYRGKFSGSGYLESGAKEARAFGRVSTPARFREMLSKSLRFASLTTKPDGYSTAIMALRGSPQSQLDQAISLYESASKGDAPYAYAFLLAMRQQGLVQVTDARSGIQPGELAPPGTTPGGQTARDWWNENRNWALPAGIVGLVVATIAVVGIASRPRTDRRAGRRIR